MWCSYRCDHRNRLCTLAICVEVGLVAVVDAAAVVDDAGVLDVIIQSSPQAEIDD